jgi:hypothetical protein
VRPPKAPGRATDSVVTARAIDQLDGPITRDAAIPSKPGAQALDRQTTPPGGRRLTGAPRASTPAPTRPLMTTPVPPVTELRRSGRWRVLGVDSVGKRAACRCDCGVIREIALDALESGASLGCGCRMTPKTAPVARRSASSQFANEIASLEALASSRRHKGSA